jgi:hypothetical protein
VDNLQLHFCTLHVHLCNLHNCTSCRRKDCHVEETGLLVMGAGNHAARLRAKEAAYSAAE